jgi:hypothetical protein
MAYMEIIKFKINDIVELKKAHPCGSKKFRVLRVGSEIRIICLGCSRDMVIDRIKLEKATKKIESADDAIGGNHE